MLTPTGPNTFSTTFQRAVMGPFFDTFDIAPTSFSGLVSVSLRAVSGPINFAVASLGNEGFGFLPESGLKTFDFQSRFDANTPHELFVVGFAGDAENFVPAAAVYAGTITAVTTVAAVPEPETYALMLAGLAMLGAVGRRVRKGRPSTV
ncbi:MAG: FxDxF family PEP-CTERM protein [Pseudomonadota bacterium]|nr:FxDxF family PEP-CTERM protein [Pseudomonadota bacterium]